MAVSFSDKKEARRQDAISKLRTLIKPKDTIYCILRHTSPTGERMVSFHIAVDKSIVDVTCDIVTSTGTPILGAVTRRLYPFSVAVISESAADLNRVLFSLSNALYRVSENVFNLEWI